MALKPETIEQINLFNWIRNHPRIKKCSFSIPNDGKRTPQRGFLMKRMGMMPGVSDIFIACPTKRYAGLFVELKACDRNGIYRKPTLLQVEFINEMLVMGYMASVCNGAEEAKKLIINYLNDCN